MPQRFLRPGIRTSERWNAVSRDAQALYIAILTLVDDFGRYDARDVILWADAFTVWNIAHPDSPVPLEVIHKLKIELQQAKLVDFYEADGKKVLQIVQWQERIRKGVKEKWPAKQKLQQLAATCSNLPPSTPSSSSSPSPTPSADESVRFATLKRLESQLNTLYKREPTDQWSYAEQTALCDVCKRESPEAELYHLIRWRRSMPPDQRKKYFPQMLYSLLSRWTEHLDKARIQCPAKPAAHSTNNRPSPTPAAIPFDKRAQLWDKSKKETGIRL